MRNHFFNQNNSIEKWSEFASWFNTIEQRSSVLRLQASPCISDRPVLYHRNQLRGELLEDTVSNIFARTQIRKLNEFKASLGRNLGQTRSYSLPQSLGGFGLPHRADHKYTAEDLRVATLAVSHHKLFKEALRLGTPRLPTAGFMSVLNKELSFVTKYLGIAKVTEIHQYSSYSSVDDNSVFKLSLLSGFLSPTNLCIEIDEREDSYRTAKYFSRPLVRQNKWINRCFNDQVKGVDAKKEIRNIESDLQNGVERKETIILDAFKDGAQIRSFRPLPKF